MISLVSYKCLPLVVEIFCVPIKLLAVFPMPQQQGSLRNIQGQAQMGFSPFMMRPVVDEDEPACGRYTPNTELLKIIQEAQPDAEPKGCDVKGCGGKCGIK